MHQAINRILATIAILAFAFPALSQDAKGSADHPLIGRYGGSTIHAYQFANFDEVKMKLRPGKEGSEIFEGELTRIHYKLPGNVSVADAFRNFRFLLIQKGFDVRYTCVTDKTHRECSHNVNWMDNFPIDWRYVHTDAFNFRVLNAVKITDAGKIHAQVLVTKDGPVRVLLTVLEEAILQNNMIDAAEIQNQLTESGRVALYGVYFDTDSAQVKPASTSTLKEITYFLKTNSDLKIIIVGHTDNQGSMEYNLDLSARRASSIRAVLISEHGIDNGRIQHAGVGFLAPVATNATSDGRALNRRVEIVAR